MPSEAKVSGTGARLAEEYCRDEYTDYVIYSMLARREKNPERKRILERLAEQEYDHMVFWNNLLGGQCKPRVSRFLLFLVVLSRMIFGLMFTLKLLERGEEETIQAYKNYLPILKGPEREGLEKIIHDEETHERSLLNQIDEAIIKYMSFIVLGLADAIVEITGVHAGFLGVTSNTIVAGIAGLVVGFSAAISMASAAYLQAKQETHRSPVTSALFTGVAYIGAVAILAAPYFLTHNMVLAFTVSILLAVALIVGFTFYGSIVFEKGFLREFLETTVLMLGTAFAAYLFGEMLGTYFGLRGLTLG